jgi:UrcA family protein
LRIRILLGLFGAAAIVGSAHAASQTDPFTGVLSASVSSRGLDLSRAEDAKIMLGRLRQAASDVCGGAPRPMELQRAADYRICVRETLDGAVGRVGAPLVADLYRASQRTTTLVASGEER